MSKIKIISNPYQKETIFQCFDENKNEWNDINSEGNSNSGLLQSGLRTGFFPFKAKQIIDTIITEYFTASSKVNIEFEGTDDEYKEFDEICSDEKICDKIELTRSSKVLENARDILPDVIKVFKKLQPLVAESVSDIAKTKRELEKFADASNDIVPICVIGNYSSGKSTFINALIGYELLPSSDEPTTAKIYKISQSKYDDRAEINFEFNGKDVKFKITDNSFSCKTGADDNELSKSLTELLKEREKESIPVKLNCILEALNTYANRTKNDTVSDLIEIEAPFDDDGLWNKIGNNFVIFDTPGSNSASNLKHYQVLKKAMENLSNGLPIFVSEYDSLDSTDNDKLYQDINNMEELDNRFTMIIVNKADAASLKKNGYTEEDRDRILNLSIPRNLYSGGIYFVSSIIGLGAKNDEVFINDHNAEVFDDQKSKYSDPKSRFYKQLYHYDILPEQIRKRYDAESETHSNLLYANSGLFAIEQAIKTFSGVYSHYNKCQQSQLFLDKIIQITSNEIKQSTLLREENLKHMTAQLEREKAELIATLESKSTELKDHYVSEYPLFMQEFRDQVESKFNYYALKEKEKGFRQTEQEENEMGEREKDVDDAVKSLFGGIRNDFKKTFSERGIANIKNIGSTVKEGIKDISEKLGEQKKAKDEVDNATADELIGFIREEFTTAINNAQVVLDKQSKAFWAERTESYKRMLTQIVTESTALTDVKREEVSGIIIEYQDLTFESYPEFIFDKDAFRIKFFVFANRLDIFKLTRRYNNEMNQNLNDIYKQFEESHRRSFNTWMNNLLSIIMDNIVEFNPTLHNQSEIIKENTLRIADLESRMAKLNDYDTQVKRMMEWKEA
jgi:GTPase SAR1 family protein